MRSDRAQQAQAKAQQLFADTTAQTKRLLTGPRKPKPKRKRRRCWNKPKGKPKSPPNNGRQKPKRRLRQCRARAGQHLDEAVALVIAWVTGEEQ